MKFLEAFKFVEDGKKVRRLSSGQICSCSGDMADYLEYVMYSKLLDDLESEWEIYKETEKTYSFLEILPGLKSSKTYRRKDWDLERKIYTASGGVIWEFLKGFPQLPLNIRDVEANDWVEMP